MLADVWEVGVGAALVGFEGSLHVEDGAGGPLAVTAGAPFALAVVRYSNSILCKFELTIERKTHFALFLWCSFSLSSAIPLHAVLEVSSPFLNHRVEQNFQNRKSERAVASLVQGKDISSRENC